MGGGSAHAEVVSGFDLARQCGRVAPDQAPSIWLAPTQSGFAYQLGSNRDRPIPSYSTVFLRGSVPEEVFLSQFC